MNGLIELPSCRRGSLGTHPTSSDLPCGGRFFIEAEINFARSNGVFLGAVRPIAYAFSGLFDCVADVGVTGARVQAVAFTARPKPVGEKEQRAVTDHGIGRRPK